MFGRGEIDISIQKTSYAPGDTISGSVNLTLKKPVKAKEMTISLVGEYMTKVITRRPRGVTALDGGIAISDELLKSMPMYYSKTHVKNVRICGFKQQLDGESDYSQSREYHFEIKTTADIPTWSAVKWYLLAKLDIPRGPDITKKVRITIG